MFATRRKAAILGRASLILASALAATVYGCASGGMSFEAARSADSVEAYRDFIHAHGSSPRVPQAVELAAALIDRGVGLASWPEFLRLIGGLEGEYSSFIARYLEYPVTEIRRSAFTVLATRSTREAGGGMPRDHVPAVLFAVEDPDPWVRIGARRLAVLAGHGESLSAIPESSPTVRQATASLGESNSGG